MDVLRMCYTNFLNWKYLYALKIRIQNPILNTSHDCRWEISKYISERSISGESF